MDYNLFVSDDTSQTRKERRESAERNQIEGKLGQGKRGYGLNNIRVRLSTTSNSWMKTIIFVMNLIRHVRDFSLSFLHSPLVNLMKVGNLNWYPVMTQLKIYA